MAIVCFISEKPIVGFCIGYGRFVSKPLGISISWLCPSFRAILESRSIARRNLVILTMMWFDSV